MIRRNMSRLLFVERARQELGIEIKKGNNIYNLFLETLEEALLQMEDKDILELHGVGTFYFKEVSSKKRKSLITGKEIEGPKWIIDFQPARKIRDAVRDYDKVSKME